MELYTKDMRAQCPIDSIANSVLDCLEDRIKHIDRMLKAYYLLICEETGYPTTQLLEDHQKSKHQ